jgi:hypothetical protein
MGYMSVLNIEISFPDHWVVTLEDVERVIKKQFTDKFSVRVIEPERKRYGKQEAIETAAVQ